MNTVELGKKYEEKAARFLKGHGYRVVAMSFRREKWEIDIIASRSNELVFVEVKYRKHPGLFNPLFAIDGQKKENIRKCAELFLIEHPEFQFHYCCFDVIIIIDEGGRLKYKQIKQAF